LALAVLTKYNVALIALPFALGFSGKERLRFTLAFLGSALVAYMPFLVILKPPALFGSLMEYTVRWQYNGSLYYALRLFTSPKVSKIIIAPIIVTALVYIGLRVKDRIKGAFASLVAYMALTPTLFPWYLALAFPFMTLRRSPALFTLFSLVFLSYWGLMGLNETGAWSESWLIRVLEYLPFYALLIMGSRWSQFEPRKASGFAL
ncbi:MAG: hypothetical protein ACE5GA_10495, partial [Candidatus Zixiibacteriota bacterium]